ncbi:cohesin subunit SA-1 [Nephila pilipes]|uniref:Cohesin subunit SA-1 n=1 Tax=Nephila pilipes TaxID=299642 RepID=A0A8X6TWL7_NEPPI|nr:cohesin subunit SA-1 [Nephila pilipes]
MKIFIVTSAMKKFQYFTVVIILGPWSIWDNIYDFGSRVQYKNKGLPEEVVKYTSCCSMGIMWDLAMLDDTSPLPVAWQVLLNRLKDFTTIEIY